MAVLVALVACGLLQEQLRRSTADLVARLVDGRQRDGRRREEV